MVCPMLIASRKKGYFSDMSDPKVDWGSANYDLKLSLSHNCTKITGIIRRELSYDLSKLSRDKTLIFSRGDESNLRRLRGHQNFPTSTSNLRFSKCHHNAHPEIVMRVRGTVTAQYIQKRDDTTPPEAELTLEALYCQSNMLIEKRV